jgi:uncharacterized membrane protein YciS (DUF1049 family)
MTSSKGNSQNNIAESLKMFCKSLYQMATFLATMFIIGGKAIFDLLHFKFVKPERKAVASERVR